MSWTTERELVMGEGPRRFSGAGYRGICYLDQEGNERFVLSCGIQHCPRNFRVEYAPRPGWHLHMVISGIGYLTVNGKTQRVHEGQLFLIKPGEVTAYRSDTENPWYYTWVTYGGPKAGRYMNSAGFGPGVNVLDSQVDAAEFLSAANALISHDALSDSEELQRLSLALRYLSLALLSRARKSQIQLRDGLLSPDDYVRYAVDYLDQNYAHVKIADVSAYLGINRTYLSAIFRKKMYMSPQEYLIQLRMDKSRQLLQKNWPVYMIAQSVGYDDQLAFSRMFKKKFGVSPENFRKASRGQEEQGKNQSLEEI